MNIIRLLQLAAATTLLSAPAKAQSFYVRAGAGYAMPMAAQNLGSDGAGMSGYMTLPTAAGDNTGYNVKNISLNTGAQMHFGLGYMFSRQVGIELAANYLVAPRRYTVDIYNYVSNTKIPYNATLVTHASTPLFIAPMLVVQSGGNTSLYAKVGPAIPVYARYDQEETLINLPGYGKVSTIVINNQFHSRFAVGINAAAGVSAKAGVARFWVEANILSASFMPDYVEVTSATVDGVEFANTMPGNIKYTYYSNNTSTGNERLAHPTPFSNVAIAAGVAFPFAVEGNHKMLKDLRKQKKKELQHKKV